MRLFSFLMVIAISLLPGPVWGLCVSASQANLRAKPSAKSKLLWTAGRYMPLVLEKDQGGWLLVKDVDGQRAWISRNHVSDDIDCAVIRVNQSSLRSGPGTEFKKTPLQSAFKYTPFRKLQREGAWLYLQDLYGQKHWVIEGNLWEPLAYTQLNY